MKKIITGFIFLLVIFLSSSCQKGDTGTAGITGTSAEDGCLVMQFQEGVFPSTFYAGTSDTRIVSDVSSNLNYGSCSNLEFGYDVGRIWRVLLKFNVTKINSSAVVKAAYLTLNGFSVSNAVDVVVYKVKRNWLEGSGSCSGVADIDASWNYYAGTGNSWTTPGGDYDIATQSEVKTVTTTGYYTIKLNNAMVQEWIQNSSKNYGMIVKALNETNGYIANRDKTAADKAQRPKLTVYYTLP